MKDKENPFAHKPAGNVRFLDVPEIDHIETGKHGQLTTGWHKLQEVLAANPMPKMFHITCGLPARDPRGVMQAWAREAYAYMLDRSSRIPTVCYARGQWFARSVSGTFVQVWNAPPTWKQVRNARRMMYAQLRLEKQLAEAHNGLPEVH